MPEAFTGRRNELVKQLKAAGKKEEAARIAGLRRPAVHVWAANLLARRRPLAVTRLLGAAADLAEAQEKAVTGGGGGAGERLRRDSGAYQRALELAVREGAALLRDGDRALADETLRRLRDVLAGAALGGDAVRGRLGAGILQEEPPAPGAMAFAFAGSIPEVPARTAPPGRGKRPAAGGSTTGAATARSDQGQVDHRRLLEARKAADVNADAAKRLEQVARRARRRAQAAAAEAASAEREAVEAETRSGAASREAKAAAAALLRMKGGD